MRRFATFLLIVLTFTFAQPVFAHANLLRSTPAANTSLSTPPTEIRLWFTEAIDPDYSRLSLLDQNGERITLDNAQVDADDSHQLVSTVSDLPDGIYTASWRVVSTTDGHSTEGSFTFGIGENSHGAVQRNHYR